MPKTYTIKGLEEREYQAMREMSARSGVSINKWILSTIRERISKDCNFDKNKKTN